MNNLQLITDFLIMNRGAQFDAIKASQAMKLHWGISLDWHEFACALDTMEEQGYARLLPISSIYRKYRIL